MTERPIKIPGPDHPITVTLNSRRVVVTLGGKVIADTRDALTLREASCYSLSFYSLPLDAGCPCSSASR